MKTLKNKMIFESGDNLYFIADTHFDHGNIRIFCNRPFSNLSEMNDSMIDNWNRTVTDDDTVFILGDFCWSSGQRYLEFARKLKGKKILILGNHDFNRLPEDWAGCFEAVYERLEIWIGTTQIVLDHYPMREWNGMQRGSYQLHGHAHNNDQRVYHKNQLNVCVENIEYTPIPYKTVKALIDLQAGAWLSRTDPAHIQARKLLLQKCIR
jgi:calcineurin-like phosphoesterase family protein